VNRKTKKQRFLLELFEIVYSFGVFLLAFVMHALVQVRELKSFSAFFGIFSKNIEAQLCLPILMAILFYAWRRTIRRNEINTNELREICHSIRDTREILAFSRFFRSYINLLKPFDSSYQPKIHELINTGPIRHINYVPDAHLFEYYKHLTDALDTAKTWDAIHQGNPESLGIKANSSAKTPEGRMTKDYFNAQKRCAGKNCVVLRRCIILNDEEISAFLSKENYNRFWNLTGKFVKCYLCKESDLEDYISPDFNLQDIRMLEDSALYDNVFALYFKRPEGGQKTGTIIFDHGFDHGESDDIRGDAPLLRQTRLVQQIFKGISDNQPMYSLLTENSCEERNFA
jgi:hypothetical protein